MSNPKKSIKNVRVDYKKSNIDFLSADSSPYDLFNVWIKQAFEVDKDNANAFVLSTVSKDLIPSSRVVLLRGFTEEGLVFFTKGYRKGIFQINFKYYIYISCFGQQQ